MADRLPGPLRFQEAYFPRPWGGRRLADLFGKPLPADTPIGEAWLVADHPIHTSVALGGPRPGATLSELLADAPEAVLGSVARPRADGRFPLLLKLLDARETLSVQVHPDDALARALGEPDGGKTELWHVVAAEPGAELLLGNPPGEEPARWLDDPVRLARGLPRRAAAPGEVYYVPAGTTHAIGAGLLIAEIQQNSDLTYRVHDWERRDAEGRPRALHLEKAARAMRATGADALPLTPLIHEAGGLRHEVYLCCAHFAAERISTRLGGTRETGGRSFHLLLGLEGAPDIAAGGPALPLPPGAALLVPGGQPRYSATGSGTWLDFYVPDAALDVSGPLLAAGHGAEAVSGIIRG